MGNNYYCHNSGDKYKISFLIRYVFFLFLANFGYLSAQSSNSLPDSINFTDEKHRKQGFWIEYYKYADEVFKESGNYKDDKMVGIWKSYYSEKDIKSETEYQNGIMKGLFKTYRKNGMLHGEGQHKNNMVHGLFIGYDTLGQKNE